MRRICNVLYILFYFKLIKTNIIYEPFNSKKHEPINSIFGTGNRLHDISYRAYCAIKCGTSEYTDKHCCEGNSIDEMECLSRIKCDKITGDFKDYVIKIALITYFTLLIITSIIAALVSYKMTKDKQFKYNNAIAAFILVLACGLIIPIIIMKIYCMCKKKLLSDLFGADFDKCGINKLMHSVDVVEVKKIQLAEEKNVTDIISNDTPYGLCAEEHDDRIVDDKSQKRMIGQNNQEPE